MHTNIISHQFLSGASSSMPSLTFNAADNWVCLRAFIQACAQDILHSLKHKKKLLTKLAKWNNMPEKRSIIPTNQLWQARKDSNESTN